MTETTGIKNGDKIEVSDNGKYFIKGWIYVGKDPNSDKHVTVIEDGELLWKWSFVKKIK